MKIIVLNGSPHGQSGITAQYTKYLAIKFPEHTFETIEIARKINKLKRDKNYLDIVIHKMVEVDAIIWAFPVYTMLIPSQLKLFIELLFEQNAQALLQGKIATGISSSANFYDHTAHNYMQGISSDLGLKYVRGFSAEMSDILSEKGQKNFIGFAKDFFWKVNENNIFEDRTIPKINWNCTDLSSIKIPKKINKTGNKKIVIVSDADSEDKNLLKMIGLFESQVSHPVDIIELGNTKIKGGCIGCLKCGDGDACFYKDEYADAFDKVRKADIVIYAGTIKDRYYSARFKKFIDRYFSNGHRNVLDAGLLGHIVSGPLHQLANMRETLEAHIEVSKCHRLGIVSDDNANANEIEKHIYNLVKNVEHWVSNEEWATGQTFLGVGGHKIFRDLVYHYRGVMSADYKFYKENKLLDFPTRNFSQRLFGYMLLTLKKLFKLKLKPKEMNSQRLKPFIKLLEKERLAINI